MKKLLFVSLALLISLTLVACGDKGPSYVGLDSDITGQIDLMLWSGSGQWHGDIGKKDYAVGDLTAQNDAAAYAVAKEFNKLYPNVVINVLAISGGPNDGGKIWAQELANYKNEYGVHPTIWATVDLPGDIAKGIVADLSRFEDDPLYQSMNPSIMNMMNYYGFQGGLPQYILPWGVYVNKELADDNNLDIPEIDWDIDDYTDFIGDHSDDEWYGSMDTPIRIIETGTNDIIKRLFNYDGGDEFVNLDSTEVRDLINYFQEWNDDSVYGAQPSEEYWTEYGGWGYEHFRRGKLLTYEGDPWMMGDCATPDEEWWAACLSSDWDIYPRPSTDYVDNTIGIVLDPMSVYNSCLDDDLLGCTEEEEAKIKLNYTFASFWIAATESWEAREAMQFTDGDKLSSALNDSFPVTTGDTFDEQMEIWYRPVKHQRFSDPSVMPGFHEVVRIYEEGQFWDISDKAFPWFYDVEGSRRENLYEWRNYWNPELNGGVEKGDANFVDTIIGLLADWNTEANARFAQSFEELQTGLKTYYGYKDEDFNN